MNRSSEDREILEDYCAERGAELWDEAQALAKDDPLRSKKLRDSSFYSGIELALHWARGGDVLAGTWAAALEETESEPESAESNQDAH